MRVPQDSAGAHSSWPPQVCSRAAPHLLQPAARHQRRSKRYERASLRVVATAGSASASYAAGGSYHSADEYPPEPSTSGVDKRLEGFPAPLDREIARMAAPSLAQVVMDPLMGMVGTGAHPRRAPALLTASCRAHMRTGLLQRHSACGVHVHAARACEGHVRKAVLSVTLPCL